MKRFLYILPAILLCMIYGLLAAIAGGISGFQPIAWVYLGLPIAAGILLRRGKWWGSLPGIAIGGILVYSGMTAQPQLFVGFVIGLIIAAYYIAMGLMCTAETGKHAGKNK